MCGGGDGGVIRAAAPLSPGFELEEMTLSHQVQSSRPTLSFIPGTVSA